MTRIAIHIEDEAGDRGMHERRVQQLRQATRELESTGIPGDMTLQLAVGRPSPCRDVGTQFEA